jgi:hypothetical protein
MPGPPMLVILTAAALLLGAAAPASPPEHPASFMGVDELKTLLERGIKADVIDVRTTPEYEQQHIRGARSIPLRSIAARINEIPRDRLVVLY